MQDVENSVLFEILHNFAMEHATAFGSGKNVPYVRRSNLNGYHKFVIHQQPHLLALFPTIY